MRTNHGMNGISHAREVGENYAAHGKTAEELKAFASEYFGSQRRAEQALRAFREQTARG